MVDCYVGTSSNEMIQRLIILQHFSSSFSLLLFVHSSRSTPSRLSLFHMVVVACFMFLHLSLVSSHHAYQSITLFTTLLIVCANDTCGGGWLLCIRIALLTVFPSLSHSGYRYLFDARTAALLVPADDRATASTFQQNDARYRLDGGLTGYHYIAKAQWHLSLHTSSCASPRWRYQWLHRSICPPINVYYLKCRIITLNPTQCFSTSIHPAPYTTAYCLLLITWLDWSSRVC